MNIPEDKKVSGVILAKTREHVISLEGSYSLHLMAKDFDGNIRTTTFLPGDDHACCVMTVTVSFQVRTVWSYRNSDAFGWDYYGEASSNITGTRDVCQYLLVNGNPNLPVFPRGWKVEIYLDGAHEADEYFEITSNGRYIETSQNVISTQTSMYSYIALWSVAYFNNRTGNCHDYLERWYKPDGSLYTESTGGWSDYKSPANPERDYWSAISYTHTRFFYGGIPIGVWRIEVYLDQYYDGGWEWIHIATCSITVRPPGMSPIAILSASPTEVQVHETVTLNGSASYDPDGGTINSYLYDFGDGSNSSWTSQPIYYWEYTAPGDYSVKLKVKDDEGDISNWSNITYIHVNPAPTLNVSTYTDKYNYSAGDTMHLGLVVSNTDGPMNACFAVWVVRPSSQIYLYMHMHNITLSAGFSYNNPSWQTLQLPTLPSGTYVWHAAFLNPAAHTILVEDTAQWQFN